jgi:hypothetical protein
MKPTSVTAPILSRLLLLAALLLGALTVLTSYYPFQGSVVSAHCTRSGHATYLPDGTPQCDCSAELNGGNCTCIIKCPPGELE